MHTVFDNLYNYKWVYISYRVSTTRGKQGKWPKRNPCQGKHREFRSFAKTQGILFAQVVNSLILKVKDNAIFTMKYSKFF